MKNLMTILALFVVCLFIRAQQNDVQRHGLNGKVRSCKTLSYSYQSGPDGKLTANRDLLQYGGDGYEVDGWYGYDTTGNILLAYSIPKIGSRADKRVYKRDEKGRINES